MLSVNCFGDSRTDTPPASPLVQYKLYNTGTAKLRENASISISLRAAFAGEAHFLENHQAALAAAWRRRRVNNNAPPTRIKHPPPYSAQVPGAIEPPVNGNNGEDITLTTSTLVFNESTESTLIGLSNKI